MCCLPADHIPPSPSLSDWPIPSNRTRYDPARHLGRGRRAQQQPGTPQGPPLAS